MITLTDKQREVMEHALGIKGSPGKKPYRNHYSTEPGHHGLKVCEECVWNGWMVRRQPNSIYPYSTFSVTTDGARALGLDPDDPLFEPSIVDMMRKETTR